MAVLERGKPRAHKTLVADLFRRRISRVFERTIGSCDIGTNVGTSYMANGRQNYGGLRDTHE